MASLSSLHPSPIHPFYPSEKDRFGLPRGWLISESKTERAAREGAARRLAADAFFTVILHLGRAEAEQLFKKALRAQRLPAKGKRARRGLNAYLLRLYDMEIAAGEIPKRNIASQIAAWLQANDPDFKRRESLSLAAHIRRLVKERERAETARKRAQTGMALEAVKILGDGAVRRKTDL
jgi:hypothetical protein